MGTTPWLGSYNPSVGVASAAAAVLPQSQRRSLTLSRHSGGLVLLVALAVLLGWLLDIPLLKAWLPGRAAMNPVTAIVFMIASCALLIAHEGSLTPMRRLAVRVCGAAVVLLPILCLSRFFLRWDLGPDLLLFQDVGIGSTAVADRMAPLTGLTFELLGIAILLLPSQSRAYGRAASVLATLASLVAFAVIVDYGYHSTTLLSMGGRHPVALNTAVAFLVLAAGLISARPDTGLMALIISGRVGGVLSRRLLPMAVLVPLLIGWLEVRGEYHGLFDGPAGDALVAIATTLVLSCMVWQSAVAIDRADDARTRAEADLRDLNEHLESRVRERTHALERVNDEVHAGMEARRHAEEELRRTADEMRGVFEASPLAICSLTPDDLVLSWNPAAEQFFGWTAEEVIGKKLPIVSEALRSEAFSLTHQALGGTPVTNVETRRLDKNGNAIDVSISTAALFDAGGNARGIVAVYADMRDRKHLESQLRQSQKMEAIGRLAGGVAHDFNNILTVIQAAAEFLLADLDGTDPRRADAGEIANAAQRAAKLTRQLLAFSRQQVLELQVLDLNAVVQPLEPMLRRLLETNIDLSIRGGPGLDQIKADPGQLEQVILNLVVNARDAMPDGGAILIETDNVLLDAEYPREHLNARPGPHVMLAVTDTGMGMDAETQSRIFEPFFTTKPIGSGTGLGLATVHGIVEQLGGHIWVYSEVGSGTTFKIYFPALAEPVLAVSPVAKPQAQVVSRGARILLVEDDAAVRAAVKGLLQRHHYAVTDVANGQEAVAHLEQAPNSADLVLSDMMMPGITGLELRATLRDMGATFPVLLMSGYSEGAMRRLGSIEELAPHIEKPFTADRLVGRIEELLSN